MDDTEEPKPPPILRLPLELLAEILRYVIKIGDKEVTITGEDLPSKQRRWERELARLKNAEWKPQQKRAIPSALTACTRLYDAVAEAFWGKTTFIIQTSYHLQGFLQTRTGQIAAANLRRLSFGPKYQWHDFVMNHPKTEFEGRSADMRMFLPFQNLKRLELCTGALVPMYGPVDLAALLTQQEVARAKPAWCQTEAMSEDGLITLAMDRWYLRDHLLMTIPDAVFDRLDALSMYAAAPLAEEPIMTDVLQYARDLRTGAWTLDEVTGLARCGEHSFVNLKDDSAAGIVEESSARLNRKVLSLWVEARAAVYWAAAGNARLWWQWCTWSKEWKGIWRPDLMSFVQGRPRTYEEIFMADGTVRGNV